MCPTGRTLDAIGALASKLLIVRCKCASQQARANAKELSQQSSKQRRKNISEVVISGELLAISG
jgi:hypothetical protein